MVRFLKKMDDAIAQGKKVTELWVDRELTALRAEQPGFLSLSFETIAGFGAHGAIVHYEATEETDAEVRPNGLLLLDSGAHYDCGTTDITRTIAIGEPAEEERRVYTLVLKGHLQLQAMHFPQGTTGLQLDTVARAAMWREGYDFGHGTGHGVGHVLGVHEGPVQIRKNHRADTVLPVQVGLVITDEPGIYVQGKFGVRIENCLLCLPAQETEFGSFLRFEPLTLCPYDRKLIVSDMLAFEERQWLNSYHAQVRSVLLPLLSDEAERAWLENATLPI
jgi:Xaa-Pro aminopeptidase